MRPQRQQQQPPRIVIVGAVGWQTSPPGGGDWREGASMAPSEEQCSSLLYCRERLLQSTRERKQQSGKAPEETGAFTAPASALFTVDGLLGQSAQCPDGPEVSVEWRRAQQKAMLYSRSRRYMVPLSQCLITAKEREYQCRVRNRESTPNYCCCCCCFCCS